MTSQVKKARLIYSTPAILFDGLNQLPGVLELTDTELLFRPATFAGGHLQVSIPLANILHAELFLVFDLAKNGLKITSKDGKTDLFVFDKVVEFKSQLSKTLEMAH